MNLESIKTCTIEDAAYPKLLRETVGPPPLLYYMGALPKPDDLCLAVVGTRKMSDYGRLATERIAGPLSQSGLVIVSGMALGIDGLAHRAALQAGQRTIAIVAGGLDEASLYPHQHLGLAREILAGGGAILSEQPPGTLSYKVNFISRNRIISGLSVGTLVVECPERSGALITARYALEQNRNVYAVPGSIYSAASDGPNNLIKQGAIPVTEAGDILRDLNLEVPTLPGPTEALTDREQQVLQYISKKPTGIEDVVKNSGLPAATVTAALVMLELKGYIINAGGDREKYLRNYE